MSESTQTRRLEQYLGRHGTITPLTALRTLGIYRLSARILDLRRAGRGISTKMVRVGSRDRRKCVAQYRLEW